jgi:D-amino-acid dehydrogenase
MTTEPHVLVLGGGIIGVTSAYYLARRGCRVTLVERQPGVGLETSFANGSLVTPSQFDPWAAPGLPWKLLKWIGREDAPFLLRPRALPGLLS